MTSRPMELFRKIPSNSYTTTNIFGIYLVISILVAYASLFSEGFFRLTTGQLLGLTMIEISVYGNSPGTIPVAMSIFFSLLLLADLSYETLTGINNKYYFKCLKSKRHLLYMLTSISIILCGLVHVAVYDLNWVNLRFFLDGGIASILAYVDLANRRLGNNDED